MTRKERDIYQETTDHIIAEIEKGAASWRMPWHVSEIGTLSPVNIASKRPYQGINILCLWAAASREAFTSSYWGTFRQWNECGATVRKGERATSVVFWHIGDRERKDAESEEPTNSKRFFLARSYPVFNASQVDGFTPPLIPACSEAERIETADAFVASLSPSLHHHRNAAYFDVSNDSIHIPHFKRFREPLAYYAVLSHELTHWTGARHRLDRDMHSRFGTRGLRSRGTHRRARLGVPPGKARHRFHATPRPRSLHIELARTPSQRQAGDFHRRKSCPEGRKLDGRARGEEDTGRIGMQKTPPSHPRPIVRREGSGSRAASGCCFFGCPFGVTFVTFSRHSAGKNAPKKGQPDPLPSRRKSALYGRDGEEWGENNLSVGLDSRACGDSPPSRA